MIRKKETSEVFGVSNTILIDSYVDRGNLDSTIQRHLSRSTHIALRGESKCGKSWFRQKNIPDALVVQCRYGRNVIDIYTDALSQLDIKLTVEQTSGTTIKGRVETNASTGINLLAKLGIKAAIESARQDGAKTETVGHDINDLKFIADLIKKSERRLVIEDFHYLAMSERKRFAYDLKTLWDYGCFVIIIGVWSQSNMLIYLNKDLSGRIVEMSIYWSEPDLNLVLEKGSKALNITFSKEVQDLLVKDCFGNIGILQKLTLLTLDEAEIYEAPEIKLEVDDINYFKQAAMSYANQLDALYQQFARTVSSGIRKRKDSTGIYAHAMAVIVDAEEAKLINGLGLDEIFQIANERQPRIQKVNLRTILNKLEELQVDEDGRGLVIAFDESNDEVTAVDRQLLFYRKHLTMKWPWEDLIREINEISNITDSEEKEE